MGKRWMKGELARTSSTPWEYDREWSEREKRRRQHKSRNKLRGKAKAEELARQAKGEASAVVMRGCSSKVRYKTERQALANQGKNSPISAYICSFCGGWHLTHKRQRSSELDERFGRGECE